jgi:hypothetical protein
MSEERHLITEQLTPPDDLAVSGVDKDLDQSSAEQQEGCALGFAPAGATVQEYSQSAPDEDSSQVSNLSTDSIEIVSDAAPSWCPEIKAPGRDERLISVVPSGWSLRAGFVTGALITALGLAWVGGGNSSQVIDFVTRVLTGKPPLSAVVERIVDAESNGCPNAKNNRSSATGAGQFLDQTWLYLIRAHRPDLARRGEKEVLELRRDPKLAREITMRLAERNAALLGARGLPVTRGTLYLSHFAGGAGAVALLSASDDADAAAIMASADAPGRTTREKIVEANPFLQRFTVADLKSWADRKMQGPGFRLTDFFPGNSAAARPITKVCP